MLSNCEKCWDTPCGYNYKHLEIKVLKDLIKKLNLLVNEKELLNIKQKTEGK